MSRSTNSRAQALKPLHRDEDLGVIRRTSGGKVIEGRSASVRSMTLGSSSPAPSDPHAFTRGYPRSALPVAGLGASAPKVPSSHASKLSAAVTDAVACPASRRPHSTRTL
jgi:hypothetical protein